MKMRRILFFFVGMMLLLSCCSATAEGILLPTPPPASPTPAPEQQTTEPDPMTTKQVVSDLPDPSYIIRTGGEEHENYLTIHEIQYDARIYPVYNIGNAISDYLDACTAAGYKWEISDIFNDYLAYRIFGGEKDAYFVPEYGQSVLLLKAHGMPVQEMMARPEAYEKDKMLFNVNGVEFQTDFYGNYFVYPLTSDGYSMITYERETFTSLKGKNLVFYSESAPYQLIAIAIPENARTSEKYTVKRSNVKETSTGFVLVGNYNPSSAHPQPGVIEGSFKGKDITVMAGREKGSMYPDLYQIGLTSESDYVTVQLVYRSGNEYRGRVEGEFMDGKMKVNGTFWVVK